MNTHWYRRIEHNGIYEEEEGYLDDFQKLLGNGAAQVEMSTTFGLDFATVKVIASVRITCDQSADIIDKAGKLAFFKSMEFARDGLTHAIPAKDQILKDIYGGG